MLKSLITKAAKLDHLSRQTEEWLPYSKKLGVCGSHQKLKYPFARNEYLLGPGVRVSSSYQEAVLRAQMGKAKETRLPLAAQSEVEAGPPVTHQDFGGSQK